MIATYMINPGIKRKFGQIFSNLSDLQIGFLLSEYEIDMNMKPEMRFDKIKEIDNILSTSGFKKIWALAELCTLYSSWVSLNITKSNYKSLKELKKKFNHKIFKANNLTILLISKKPKIFGIYFFSESKKSLIDRALLPEYSRECVYYVPKFNLVLTDIHADEEGNSFQDILNSIFSEMESFRTKTMVISKFYNNNTMINDLHVMSDHQVAGFSGMDQIAFHGDHIKQGLYGLHKRQDIRVHLDQIGPRIEVSGHNLHLKIGPKVKVKGPDGFKELTELIEEFH